ncbi:MAG: hypothetical protein AB7P69_03710 [Candidatus Binatia bacterium]
MTRQKSKIKNQKLVAYLAQNRALFKAAAQLGLRLDDLREMAAAIDPLHRRSLSLLSLTQRRELLDDLITKGADVRNPQLTEQEVGEARRADRGGKLIRFPAISSAEEEMIKKMAAHIHWREPDGFLRLCHKLIKSSFPRNHREVTTMRLALQSLLQQQSVGARHAVPLPVHDNNKSAME